jgi:arsenate reductase
MRGCLARGPDKHGRVPEAAGAPADVRICAERRRSTTICACLARRSTPARARPRARDGGADVNVLFVCVANSGRSVLAEHLFRRAAGGRHDARSAGSEPGAAVHPRVVEALGELGIDVRAHLPRKLDDAALAWADVAVSTCSDAVCPVTPGVRRIGWAFDDPKDLPLDRVRAIRDEIDRHVRDLLVELDAQAGIAGCTADDARRPSSRTSGGLSADGDAFDSDGKA